MPSRALWSWTTAMLSVLALEHGGLTPQRGDILAFMASRIQAGARPRSTARQLSSFRRFYRYLVRENVLREDPTAQIAMPKIGRSLPKSLTISCRLNGRFHWPRRTCRPVWRKI